MRRSAWLWAVIPLVGCDLPNPLAKPKAPPPAVVAAPAPVETVQVPAQVGVGKRGESLRGETGVGGVIASPAVAFFNIREKAVFEIQIPHALQLYKAQSSDGKGPKSHELFMQEIIAANNIKLPELPATHRYLYNVEQEQLYVERPAPQ